MTAERIMPRLDETMPDWEVNFCTSTEARMFVRAICDGQTLEQAKTELRRRVVARLIYVADAIAAARSSG